MSPLVIFLPYPPSVNRIWRSGKTPAGKTRVYRNAKYPAWLRECEALCMANGWHKRPIKGHFQAFIILDENRRRKNTDADNRIKACLDVLERMCVIENDALADKIEVVWGVAPDGCTVALEPVAIQADKGRLTDDAA